NDNDKLCYYNFMDSVYVKLIGDKKDTFDFFWGLKRVTGLPYIEDTFFNSRIIDTLLMRMDRDKFVYPTKIEVEGERYEGAIVFQPVPGYYEKGVAILDFSRAYPTFMIKHNLSPEVFVLGLKEEGCLPKLCRVLLDEREVHEKVMEEIFECDGPECDEYKTAKLKRDVVKYLLNAVYGVTGSKHFRLFHPEVAGTVTKIGREALREVKKKAEELGYDVIYGDTDSIFVVCESVEVGHKIAESLGMHVNVWFEELEVTAEWVNVD
ncbi:MAG: DNA polymerase domain-containing protein, partial [Planctomycetota bacterium]